MEQVYKQWINEKNKNKNKQKNAVALKYIKQDIMMVVIYCYLEKENYKVFKFSRNNFCYFEIGLSFKAAIQ